MRFGVVVFPGTNCETETRRILAGVLGQEADLVWHEDRDLSHFDAVVLPGGFSYGDYLRCGAMARFSPVMEAVARFARDGGLVLGICNGFQILLEAGLLPGAILRNRSLKYVSRFVHLRVERADTPFTNRFSPGQVVRVPIAHYEGNYFADAATLDGLERGGQVLFRYCDPGGRTTEAGNPNGSLRSIAGICDAAGNVMGMMPHPERAAEPVLGCEDGRGVFESLLRAAPRRARTEAAG
ncbi:MAG: phosphoribosylformylglycinamidine synthase subunit PurQ [Acidobacteria bacterium]|nr:phosphoribosylformylglycinamidine synthase subunit PurQ [Acidobacteriota bacterium]